MISRLRHYCSFFTLQQTVAVSLLAAMAIALIPIPTLPLPTAHELNGGKDLSRPFPCQDRPCGCRSADQCRKKCCCFSADQKLAWAKRHRVPATDAVFDTQCEIASASGVKGCCSASRSPKKSDPARLAKSKSKSMAKRASHSRVVIGVVAQQCHGVAHAFTGQAVFVIPPIFSVQLSIEPNGERLVATDLWFQQIIGEPPIPPPRLLAAECVSHGRVALKHGFFTVNLGSRDATLNSDAR